MRLGFSVRFGGLIYVNGQNLKRLNSTLQTSVFYLQKRELSTVNDYPRKCSNH